MMLGCDEETNEFSPFSRKLISHCVIVAESNPVKLCKIILQLSGWFNVKFVWRISVPHK